MVLVRMELVLVVRTELVAEVRTELLLARVEVLAGRELELTGGLVPPLLKVEPMGPNLMLAERHGELACFRPRKAQNTEYPSFSECVEGISYRRQRWRRGTRPQPPREHQR